VSERIAVLSPTTIQFVEKMAALNFETGIDVVGPPHPDEWGWNNYERRMDEWRRLGLDVRLDLRPYQDIEFAEYDLLIETYETLFIEPSWQDHCHRYECPTVVKVCWTRSPHPRIPPTYFDKIKALPTLLEMPAHLPHWETCGFSDVNLVFNPVGHWWFDKEWTGDGENAVMVLSGKDKWRLRGVGGSREHHGLDLFECLSQDFPGKLYLHDGAETYRSSQEMAELLSRARVFLSLDEPWGGEGERPLSLVFTEALSAGCPVAVRDLAGTNYKDYVDGNGIATNNYEDLRNFVGSCLRDLEFAKKCSSISRSLAAKFFSESALSAQYETIFSRARRIWNQHALDRGYYRFRPTAMSRFDTACF
jgi:glycosyltransferase involved in cell wall biosynthesis